MTECGQSRAKIENRNLWEGSAIKQSKYRGANKQNVKKQEIFEWTVTEEMGLLEFLLLHRKGKSRNNIKSLLTRGAVRVENRLVTQFDHPLRVGQTVQMGRAPEEAPTSHSPRVLYEDADLLVIHKPAGLLSIASDKEKERTAYHWMTDYVRQMNPESRIFIVHRLDRDTSGVLLVAKNEAMKQALQERWNELVQVRSYTAVVEGRLPQNQGRIHTWLKETKTMLMYSSEREGDGQEAITEYSVLGVGEDYSLVDIRLLTGRKNQIRVHMKEQGCPVAGDKKYGAKTNPFHRLGLHAGVLEVEHPFTGKILRFQADNPSVFFRIPFEKVAKADKAYKRR